LKTCEVFLWDGAGGAGFVLMQKTKKKTTKINWGSGEVYRPSSQV
jgi:hypothetical protein